MEIIEIGKILKPGSGFWVSKTSGSGFFWAKNPEKTQTQKNPGQNGPGPSLGFFIMCDFENSIHKNGKNSVKYQGKINELIY